MELVEFYRETRGNQNNHKLDLILSWGDGTLERDHDWVQWVFPSNEKSMLNDEAPTLTLEESKIFEAEPDLQKKVQVSLKRFLAFLEFDITEENDVITIQPKGERTPLWLSGFNHNMLRVTRVLKSLRLTGNTRYAVAFFDALRPYQNRLSPNTWSYWNNAVFQPLW